LSDLKIPLVNITILSYTLPVIIVTILSFLFFNEKINLKKAIGLAITIFGIYFTITNDS
jgi:drug/metabolite transporter (DMT)-like permease